MGKHKIEIRRFEATSCGWNLLTKTDFECDKEKAEKLEELLNDYAEELVDRGVV